MQVINTHTREGLWDFGRRLGYSDNRIRELLARADNEVEHTKQCERVRQEHTTFFKQTTP